jgi:hypothetical protein
VLSEGGQRHIVRVDDLSGHGVAAGVRGAGVEPRQQEAGLESMIECEWGTGARRRSAVWGQGWSGALLGGQTMSHAPVSHSDRMARFWAQGIGALQ